MKIENREISQNCEPFIIAEISQNHDGSLGQAHAFIDAVADSGADALKFQTHIAAQESTLLEPFRVNFSYEDKTRYDYWKRMEFTPEQWKGLYTHAKERSLIFLSSPFSHDALTLLDEIGVPAWKFGAGEVFNEELLHIAAKTGKPVILSTGLSTYDDITRQLDIFGSENVALLQCVTAYPSLPEQIDISLISKLKNRFHVPVGISDHSATIYPALAAATLGAAIIEVHVTMSKYMFGPDVKASVTIEQLKEIVTGTKFIHKMRTASVNMEHRNDTQEQLKHIFSKSLYYSHDLPVGSILKKSDLIAKKPNCGINANCMSEYVGKTINRDVRKDDILRKEDFT